MSIQTNKKSNKVLFILKSSEFQHSGLYQMNQYVEKSEMIHNSFQTYTVKLSSVNSNNAIIRVIGASIKALRYLIEIFYRLLTFKPDVVYFTISPVNSFIRDIIYIIGLKLFRVKLVYHLHGKGIKDKIRDNILYKLLYNYAYRGSYVIVLSEQLMDDIDDLPCQSIFVLPNCIEPCKEEYVKRSYYYKFDKPKIIFLSNLIISKGIYEFIDACKRIIDEGINIEAFIVGAENEVKKNDLEIIFNNYDENIYYLGPKYSDEKYRLLYESDIFVFPTYYPTEAFCLVILEAMQVGLPVVTTDEGAITDMIVDGKNGYITRKKNVNDLTNKIKILLKDTVKREAMGMANREKFLNNYTIEIFEKKLVNILNRIAQA